MFRHLPLPEYREPTQVTLKDGRRHYVTPEGRKYPSITTILQLKSRDAIAKWRKRVGEGEADLVKKRAGKRGKRIHQLMEDTLQNKKVTPHLMDAEMYMALLKHLKRINNIRLQEKALYSDALEIAGTCDCVAEFDGVLSIIDFKSSLKPKKKEWIHGYCLQVCAYAIMYEELFGIKPKRGVIIIGNDEEKPQVFKINTEDWEEELLDLREAYRKEYGV